MISELCRILTFVAVELGANWRGNIVILDRMIEKCKKCGVDAIKFQALSKDLLSRHPEWSWYKDSSMTEDNIDMIDRMCKSYDIQWFCTPTYPEAIGFLDKYVDIWKIRYADRHNEHLITPALNTGKQLIISTDREIEKYARNRQVKQIYCISKYPTDFGEINFDMIKRLKGWSNHCLNPLATLKAVRYGAEYVEFHLSDNLDEFAIDNKVSFSYTEMSELMGWIRKYESWSLPRQPR